MNVTDKRKENNFIDFKDVEYGAQFEYEKDLYIKTNNDFVTNDDFINAVSLKSGLLYKFGDLVKVKLVNASIVINDFEEE